METRTADTILNSLTSLVETQKMLNPKVWQEAAYDLNLLLGKEHIKMEELRQEVAKIKLGLLKAQDKRNVAAVELEIATMEIYKEMRLQEHKVDRIEEFIKIAKKNASQY